MTPSKTERHQPVWINGERFVGGIGADTRRKGGGTPGDDAPAHNRATSPPTNPKPGCQDFESIRPVKHP
jgi:hypothetical protein